MMLKLQTVKGAGWTVSSRLIGRLIDFIVLLLLARLLSPNDFGLIAIASSLISIIDMLFEIPITQALTRLKEVTKSDLDTAFTIGLIRGLFISLIVAIAAYPISLIYHDSRLSILVLSLVVAPISRGLYSPSMVRYLRGIQFMPIFFMELAGKIIGGFAAFICAYNNGSYWSLAANTIVGSVAPACISYLLAPYKPNLSMKSFSKFSSFTGWFTTSQIVAALSWQYDRIFLGYFLERGQLGRYTMASDLSVLPNQTIVGPAMRPLTAAFVSVVNLPDRVGPAFLRSIRLTMVLSSPIALGIAIEADDIVLIALGDQWAETAIYLPWLSIASLLSIYASPFFALATALDQPKLILKVNFFDALLKVTISSVAYFFGGIASFLAARVIASGITFYYTLWLVRASIRISIRKQIISLGSVAIGCCGILLAASLTRHIVGSEHLGFGRLIVVSLSGAVAYVVIISLFFYKKNLLS